MISKEDFQKVRDHPDALRQQRGRLQQGLRQAHRGYQRHDLQGGLPEAVARVLHLHGAFPEGQLPLRAAPPVSAPPPCTPTRTLLPLPPPRPASRGPPPTGRADPRAPNQACRPPAPTPASSTARARRPALFVSPSPRTGEPARSGFTARKGKGRSARRGGAGPGRGLLPLAAAIW